MKSLLVFFLWIVTCVVAFVTLFPLWMIFVTFPRMIWHSYRGNNIYDHTEWDMPWFGADWLIDKVRRLDNKNKVDKQ